METTPSKPSQKLLRFASLFMILLASSLCKASSISDTLRPPVRKSVNLDAYQAASTLIDLGRYDGLKDIASIYQDQIVQYKGIIAQQDSTISDQRKQIANLEQVKANDDAVALALKADLKKTERLLRRRTIWSRAKSVGIPFIIVGSAYAGSKLF